MIDWIKDFFGSVVGIAFLLIPLAAMITHVIFCIKAAAWTGSAIALLIVGLAVFPVGIVHGIALWLGFTWI